MVALVFGLRKKSWPIRVEPVSSVVSELKRLRLGDLRVIVFSSEQAVHLDDTHSPVPLPPTVNCPILRMVIENPAIQGSINVRRSLPARICVRACFVDGSTFGREEIKVPPLLPGQSIARLYPFSVRDLEIEDWWIR